MLNFGNYYYYSEGPIPGGNSKRDYFGPGVYAELLPPALLFHVRVTERHWPEGT